MTREEFDRRLMEIQGRFGSGLGEPDPTREGLDAAYADLAELARDPSTEADRARRRAVEAVAETLRRTYIALNLPVPEVG